MTGGQIAGVAGAVAGGVAVVAVWARLAAGGRRRPAVVLPALVLWLLVTVLWLAAWAVIAALSIAMWAVGEAVRGPLPGLRRALTRGRRQLEPWRFVGVGDLLDLAPPPRAERDTGGPLLGHRRPVRVSTGGRKVNAAGRVRMSSTRVAEVRGILASRDGLVCQAGPGYHHPDCPITLRLDRPHLDPAHPEVHHIDDWIGGGVDDLWNLALLSGPCNHSLGTGTTPHLQEMKRRNRAESGPIESGGLLWTVAPEWELPADA